MIGVVVVSKFITHDNANKFSGMVDYMDREEAITNENVSLTIKGVELNSIERKILSVINTSGNTDINILVKDKKLKNMICFEKKLFEKKEKLTRYDCNYIFKKFFSQNGEFSIENIEKSFSKTHKNIDINELEIEMKRINTRLKKLETLNYVNKNEKNNYILSGKAIEEMKNLSDFEFTSYDANKILKLIRDSKYLKSIQTKLSNNFNNGTKEGKYNYDYINKRINNNIKYGFIKENNGKLEITEKGLIEEDKIINPHRKFIIEVIKDLELKSDEFKREKEIADEKYSVLNKLEYSGMIDYMDRKKAKSINSKSDIGLFTDNKDILNSTEKNKLKNLFNKCQENGGTMWHDVISFDNKFLENHGIYDSKTMVLDNRKLKEVVRASANEMLKKEKLDESAIWCADIHYNTDNIHVHVSTVELNPSKERGKRKPNSILAMKSKVVNGIINNNEQYKRINDIIRKDIIENKKKVKSLDNIKLKKLFVEIHSKLPEDRKQWNYNYNTTNHVRPLIDKMTDIYIEKYHKDDFLKLKKELKIQEVNLKEAYGEGKNNSYKKYYDTKIKDLRTRMGNTILKEIKEYDFSLNGRKYKNNLSKTDRKALIKNSIVAISLKKIERIIENSYQHFKNQKDYKKLQDEIERNE